MERMTPDLYAKTRYFKNYRTEGWGEPCSMSKELVFGADTLRHIAGAPLIVHCGIEDREDGYHPLGMAFDFHLVGIPLLQQLYLALLIPAFRGIGVYPEWNNVGLHCDTRPIRDGYRTMWKAKYVMVDGKRKQKYEKLENIYKIVYR